MKQKFAPSKNKLNDFRIGEHIQVEMNLGAGFIQFGMLSNMVLGEASYIV